MGFCAIFVVYEAGKGIKTGTSTPQSPAYPPYFVTGVPTMVPIAPPSLVDKMSSVPPSDGSLLTASEVLFFINERICVLNIIERPHLSFYAHFFLHAMVKN